MTAQTLLTTRIQAPSLRPGLVSRPRLIARLDEGLRLGRRLTLVAAPAGFGKTTLIGEWIAQLERPVAWLAIDEGDNDPASFLGYAIAALQQVDARIGQTIRPLLASPQPIPAHNLMAALVNDLAASETGPLLVLDDYHLISAFAVHDMLAFLLENQPPGFHLVVGTREDPPLPLARLRARGQMTEIRERALRFTPAEAAAFLGETMKLSLPPGAVAALETRTEGWAAGLQLAALALLEEQDAARAEAFIAAFAGDDRYIMDYLLTEVLERQPAAVQEFLHKTAILDRLTAPLCDAVTGQAGAPSQAILESLERANLFLIPLDHRREWYRYHHLFAGVLRASLETEEARPLHRRAARWYEANGYLGQAIQHTLACAATPEDLALAEGLIGRAAEEVLFSGALLTVSGWLDALPDERLRANGTLATNKAWLLAITGDPEAADAYAQAAEKAFRGAGAPAGKMAKLLVIRSFIAVLFHKTYETAIDLAGRALESLAVEEAQWRIIALWAMAESQERTRPIAEAIATLRDANRIGRTAGNQPFTASVSITLAAALQNHGQRREASTVCQEAIAGFTDETGRVSPAAGLIFSRLGILHYEANRLEEARQCHEQGMALSEQFGLASYLSVSYGLAAPTWQALGETDLALELLQQAYRQAVQTGLADPAYFLAWEANIRLVQGDLPFASRWAETAGLSPEGEPDYLRLDESLVYGRLLLVQGRLADARRWLARLERFCRERGLQRWLISIHIQQALVAERSGNGPAARDLLAQAVQLASGEDFYRPFLDEDPQALALLFEIRSLAPAFTSRLLAQAGAPEPEATSALVEPLSQRELEVLRLIAAGLKNREIARELYITTGTVKRHTNHIYGKLGVSGRMEAVSRARELGLL